MEDVRGSEEVVVTPADVSVSEAPTQTAAAVVPVAAEPSIGAEMEKDQEETKEEEVYPSHFLHADWYLYFTEWKKTYEGGEKLPQFLEEGKDGVNGHVRHGDDFKYASNYEENYG